ncbi:hypothetical protein D3C75_1091840 [compost metagenome]
MAFNTLETLAVSEDIPGIIPCALVDVFIAGLEGGAEDGKVRQDNGTHMDHAGLERSDHLIHREGDGAAGGIVFLLIPNGHGDAKPFAPQLIPF